MKRIIKDYFTFSKKERVAVIILLLLIISFIVLPDFFPGKKHKPQIDKALQETVAVLQDGTHQKEADSQYHWNQTYQSSGSSIDKTELFEFDPNTVNAVGWKRLGLTEKNIKTIFNYINKGGKFRQPDDIRKIWGLRKEDVDRIIPFARIAETQNRTYNNTQSFSPQSSLPKSNSVIDINTATVQQFMQVPGIDHLMPYRIINFRERSGGFVNVQQLKDTYGMTDSLYQIILPYLKTDITTVKKVNINTINEYDLNKHPYISRELAKAIIIYRNQHGVYQTIDDIKKIVFINEETFQKIAPYITVR